MVLKETEWRFFFFSHVVSLYSCWFWLLLVLHCFFEWLYSTLRCKREPGWVSHPSKKWHRCLVSLTFFKNRILLSSFHSLDFSFWREFYYGGIITCLILPVVICLSQRLNMSKYKHLYCESVNGLLNQLLFIWLYLLLHGYLWYIHIAWYIFPDIYCATYILLYTYCLIYIAWCILLDTYCLIHIACILLFQCRTEVVCTSLEKNSFCSFSILISISIVLKPWRRLFKNTSARPVVKKPKIRKYI